MKHGLIFDLDGTLVDSLQGIAASLNHALNLAGMAIHPLEAVRGFIGNGARLLIERAVPAGTTEALVESVEHAFKQNYERTWPQGTVAYDGVVELLENLQTRHFSLALLSNKPHAFTEMIAAQLFPMIQFACVLGQRDGIPHKPDPTGALEIAHLLGLEPQACMVIGDSTMDIETAHNAGMKVIAVTWGFQERERLIAAGADQIADDLAALSAILD